MNPTSGQHCALVAVPMLAVDASSELPHEAEL